ncbi:hypothetical protein F7725_029070 [Dissostichus mawsoni]|uniref:Uncharacterized protein n=1 Tax=Dissostichus mawsoni TaxID=36200 RepID=A0A7J5XHE6_DISMA|nr:hypothetical protein F7725_029070 [Dissostichus mawsoni]
MLPSPAASPPRRALRPQKGGRLLGPQSRIHRNGPFRKNPHENAPVPLEALTPPTAVTQREWAGLVAVNPLQNQRWLPKSLLEIKKRNPPSLLLNIRNVKRVSYKDAMAEDNELEKLKCPLRSTNKRFLLNTLRSTNLQRRSGDSRDGHSRTRSKSLERSRHRSRTPPRDHHHTDHTHHHKEKKQDRDKERSHKDNRDQRHGRDGHNRDKDRLHE